MMRVTTTFLRGEVAASNHEWKKLFLSWKQQKAGLKQNFKKGNFRNQQRTERKQDRFTLLTKTPKEILALDKGKFKPPPSMTTPVEKRNASKFCEFHEEVRHTTDECMHLKRQIEKMLMVFEIRRVNHAAIEMHLHAYNSTLMPIVEQRSNAHYTSIKSAKVVTDRLTGRTKGYGFVKFGDESEKIRAMTEMNARLGSTRSMRIGPAANKKSVGTQPYAKVTRFSQSRSSRGSIL
ncbi:reverse transcriptase domain-containing protein [Tanacetum coccineum]